MQSLRGDNVTSALTAHRRPRVKLWLACLTVLVAACQKPAQMHGVMVEPPKSVASFDFTLPSGAAVHTAPEKGRPMVVFFGYTHCPDVCPTTLSDWKRAKQKLGADGARVRWLFVTVDPDRDTPAIAEQYARQFDAAFLGVSANATQMAKVMAEFGVTAAKEDVTDSTHYNVGHSAQAFLVDDKGRIVSMYPPGIGWDALAADLASLL